jgi:lipopolysaccharide export system permease protein
MRLMGRSISGQRIARGRNWEIERTLQRLGTSALDTFAELELKDCRLRRYSTQAIRNVRTLTHYILFEIVKVFAITLTAMTLFMILVSVSKEAYSQGLGLKQIVLLLPYVLPEALRFSVPGTILFATCSVYGRMASSNEIVAIKALGISPWTIIWPTFALAFALSLAAVVLNDLACSWGRNGTRRVVIESVEEIAYARLAQQRSYSNSQFSINVRRLEGKKLIRPVFTIEGGRGSPTETITCADAELRSDLKAGMLKLICRDTTVDIGGYRLTYPGIHEFDIPLDEASKRGVKSASDLPMSQVPEEVALSLARIEKLQQKLAFLAAEQMATGDFAALSDPGWSADEGLIAGERVRMFHLQIEPARRWANGFSCLFFVLIGAPAGILLRNSDFLTSFFACFLPILLIYYPLLYLGVNEAKLGLLSSWSVWIGNVVLAICGTWLLRRVQRY